jgi:hypothetical protein
MNQSMIKNAIGLLLLTSIVAARVSAQSEAGTFAGVQGSVEVQHAGVWRTASIGTAVFVGDHVRTGARSRTTIVLRDDSVLDLAPNTEFSLETQEFDESARHYQSLLHVAAGKIRAWVSAYYREPNARYEVETPTAVSGVRGTEFLVVYDSATEITDVVGIEEQVEVNAKLAVMGAGVEIGPHFLTQVRKGKFPTPPQHIDDARLRQYLDGVDLVGTGRRDGLNVLHPAVVGRMLAPQDVPNGGAVPPTGAEPQPRGEMTALTVGPPQESLADTLSRDIYTNTQPLLDFRQTPPGQLSTGGVHVHF